MELVILRHLWSMPGTLANQFARAKQQGYAGVEAVLPHPSMFAQWQHLLATTESRLVAQIFTEGVTVAEHLASFRQQVATAQALAPLLINSHSGCDAWSFEQSRLFCQEAVGIEADYGIPVAHETHRGRIFFHPWITDRLLQEAVDLWLCADFSHWVCVCEQLLVDQAEVLATCIARTRHIHARVG